MCQVQTMQGAQEAVAADADILVAQGNEAGGHTGSMGLLPLLARMLDTFSPLPVLAAGGIGNGRALAAVLAAGADGAWVGTAFLATPEAHEVSDEHKQRIVDSNGDDTVYTEVFDIVEEKTFGIKWPAGIASRVHRNEFVDRWHGHEVELRTGIDEVARTYMESVKRRDPRTTAMAMGQSAALVNAVRPAAEIVRSMGNEAEDLLISRAARQTQ
jgi:nitronate monooxygenase